MTTYQDEYVSNEYDEEIEVVQAVYFDECTVERNHPPCLRLSLTPLTAEDITQQYVRATLIIDCSEKYPLEVPRVKIIEAKGLSDQRHAALLAELVSFAESEAGQPVLGSLCQLATELITAYNQPDGSCSFCLGELSSSEAPLFKLLSCFHCFHQSCLREWVLWRAAHPPEEAPLHVRLQQTQIEEPASFLCPVCRGPATSADLDRISELQVDCRVESTTREEAGGGHGVPEEVRQAVKRQQVEVKRIQEAQQKRGGLYNEEERSTLIVPDMFNSSKPTQPSFSSSSSLPSATTSADNPRDRSSSSGPQCQKHATSSPSASHNSSNPSSKRDLGRQRQGNSNRNLGKVGEDAEASPSSNWLSDALQRTNLQDGAPATGTPPRGSCQKTQNPKQVGSRSGHDVKENSHDRQSSRHRSGRGRVGGNTGGTGKTTDGNEREIPSKDVEGGCKGNVRHDRKKGKEFDIRNQRKDAQSSEHQGHVVHQVREGEGGLKGADEASGFINAETCNERRVGLSNADRVGITGVVSEKTQNDRRRRNGRNGSRSGNECGIHGAGGENSDNRKEKHRAGESSHDEAGNQTSMAVQEAPRKSNNQRRRHQSGRKEGDIPSARTN